jgi:hypothetical protein
MPVIDLGSRAQVLIGDRHHLQRMQHYNDAFDLEGRVEAQIHTEFTRAELALRFSDRFELRACRSSRPLWTITLVPLNVLSWNDAKADLSPRPPFHLVRRAVLEPARDQRYAAAKALSC